VALEWSTSGPELLVELDRGGAVPLRAQLEEQLRDAVRSGRLAADERLPSSRTLAGQLRLSRGVVQECYEQLVAEGYLIARGGSATRVARLDPRPAGRPAPARPDAALRLIADFASGVPDLGLVPREDLAWAMREACRTTPNDAFDYGDPCGHERLRAVLAGYARRVRAADADPYRVVVCGGYQQALGVTLQALVAEGRSRVAVEDPGSIGTVTAAARAAGGACVPVPVDDRGIDVAALAASGARVAVITPAHQWPTGVVLAPERRHELIDWARAHDAVIVEDDYDAEFRYDRDPVGALQGLAPDCVVGVGTVSKSLAPGLRLGWAIVPEWLAAPVAAAKQVADRGAPVLDQLALATLIESGRFDRHLRRMRAEYSGRRDALVDALTQHAPHVPVTGLAAGFHAVAHLPRGADETGVVEQALVLGVRLYGMGRYRSGRGGASSPQLVMGYGNTSARAVQEGIAAIGPLLRAT